MTNIKVINMKVRTQYNESGDWVLPPYSKPIICHHSFVTFICQRKSFGIFTSWGGAPRMASRMVSCSWWTLSLLRMLNIPGELNFHWHSYVFIRKQSRGSDCGALWRPGTAAGWVERHFCWGRISKPHLTPGCIKTRIKLPACICFLPFLTTILILEYACSFVLCHIFSPI